MRRIYRAFGIAILVLLIPAVFVNIEAQNYGGTLIIHSDDEWEVVTPNYLFRDPYGAYAIYNKLVANTEIGFGIVPDLAERWEVSPDAKTYTFYLAKNVKFHDGQKCTSADVKWTFESVVKDKGYYFGQFSFVEKIETPDDYTVRIRLNQTDGAFLSTLADYYSPMILPKHLWEGKDVLKNPLNKKPIGTGPFKFEEWVEGSHLVLVRNEDYFKGRPYLDKIIIKFMKNWPVVVAGIEKGEIHMSYHTPPYAEIVRLSKLPDIGVQKSVRAIVLHMDFNLQRKPFDDVRFRHAVAYAINLTDINQKVYMGLCIPSTGTWVQSVKWAYNPNAKQPSYDPLKAEQLLDEMGLKRGSDGIRARATLTTCTPMFMGECGEVIREHLRKVGIDIKVEPIEFGTFIVKCFNKHDFDMGISGGSQGPDPNAFAFYVKTGQLRNSMQYSNPRVDELFAKGKTTANEEERKKYYFEIQEILAKDLPRINLVDYVWPYVYRKEFQGYWFQPEYGTVIPEKNLAPVFWTKAAPPTVTTKTATKPPEEAFPMTTAIIVAIVAVTAITGVYYWTKQRKTKSTS